ncbi:hypothetical protein D3C81_1675420 [compost metagenome]
MNPLRDACHIGIGFFGGGPCPFAHADYLVLDAFLHLSYGFRLEEIRGASGFIQPTFYLDLDVHIEFAVCLLDFNPGFGACYHEGGILGIFLVRIGGEGNRGGPDLVA